MRNVLKLLVVTGFFALYYLCVMPPLIKDDALAVYDVNGLLSFTVTEASPDISTAQTENTEPEPEEDTPDTMSKQEKKTITVYISKSGERYHCDPECVKAQLFATTLLRAEERGLTPCKKCASEQQNNIGQ